MSDEKHDEYTITSKSIIDRLENQVMVEKITKTLSQFINPRDLMTIGFFSAVVAGIGFYLTNYSKYWFLLSAACISIYFFCDRYDGRIARYKYTTSKRGFYADHMFDTLAVFIMLLGLGLSPSLHLVLALSIVIVYFILGIDVYLTIFIRKISKTSFGVVSPAEALSVIILSSIASAFLHHPMILFTLPMLGGIDVTLIDFVGFIVLFFLVIFASNSIARNLHYLGKKEKLYKTISLPHFIFKKLLKSKK